MFELFRKKKLNIIEKLLLAYYFAAHIYYSYRYIFKYNSDVTSPTYTDTPFIFQVGKYVFTLLFIGIMCILLLVISSKGNVKAPGGVSVNQLVISGIGVLFSIILMKSIYFKDFVFISKVFTFLPILICVKYIEDFEYFIKKFIKLNCFVLIYHVIYEGFQILNYVINGRLPALAYQGGLIRFGGGWDDPNAFGIFLLLPIIYLTYNMKCYRFNLKLFILLAISIILEILTFSFTSILLMILFYALFFLSYIRNVKLLLTATSICIFTAIFSYRYFERIYWIFEEKYGSVQAHMTGNSMKVFADNSVVALFLGNTKSYVTTENSFLAIMNNYGLLAVIIYFSIMVYFLFVGYRKNKYYLNSFNKNYRVFFSTVFMFVLLFNIGSVNLPYLIIYPINFIYFFIITLMLYKQYEYSLIIKKHKT